MGLYLFGRPLFAAYCSLYYINTTQFVGGNEQEAARCSSACRARLGSPAHGEGHISDAVGAEGLLPANGAQPQHSRPCLGDNKECIAGACVCKFGFSSEGPNTQCIEDSPTGGRGASSVIAHPERQPF